MIIASIVDELHEAVNWRLSLGLQRNRKYIYQDDTDPWPPFTLAEPPNWTNKAASVGKGLLGLPVPPGSLNAKGSNYTNNNN